MAFTKLDSGIVDSSIWAESPETRVVWITLLAKCDKMGYARMSFSGLQRASNVPVDAVKRALERLEDCDPDSRTPDDDGRRIRKIEGGWHVTNYEKYRNGLLEDAAKEYLASKKRDQRARESIPKELKSVQTCPDMSGVVIDSSASASASASGEKGSGGKGDAKEVVKPLSGHLKTERVEAKWKLWMETRRGMKKPKCWATLFNEQIDWLFQWSESQAFEILSASIRNGWQGLFPPKNQAQQALPLGNSNRPKVVIPKGNL